MFQGRDGLAGLQRKTYSDLIASVRDSRLGKELIQMQSLRYRFLALEGTVAWTADGKLNSPHVQWSLRQQWGVELSIQSHGVLICRTRSALETCALVEYLQEWCSKDHAQSSLLARPGPPKNGWGKLSDRTTAIHIFSGFPGVGTELATRIYDSGHRLIKCGMTEEELMSIEGVGKKKAAAILKAFQ